MIFVYLFYVVWTSFNSMGLYHSSNLIFPMLGMVFFIVKDFKYLTFLPKPILFIVLFHLIYFLIFNEKDFDAIKYISAKLSFILFFSILIQKNNYSYIINIYKKILMYLLIILIVGVFFGTFQLGRFEGVLRNANNLSSIAVFLLAISNSKLLGKNSSIMISLFSIIMIVLSGSRTGIICLFIIGILNVKNLRTFFKRIIPLSLVIGFFFTPFLINTLSRFDLESIFFTRATHWIIAFESIKEKYLSGYGFKAYKGVLDTEKYELMEAYFHSSSAHSAYITYFLMFGIPLGIVISTIKIYPVFISFFNNNKSNYDEFYFAIKSLGLIYILSGITESMFTGVNDFAGLLFLSNWIILNFYNNGSFKKIKFMLIKYYKSRKVLLPIHKGNCIKKHNENNL